MEMYSRAFRMDPEVESRLDCGQLAARLNEDVAVDDPLYNPFRRTHCDPVDAGLALAVLRATTEEPSSTGLLDGLPSDVLGRVLECLGWMHLPSLETVAQTSRAMFLAARQDALWRAVCGRIECPSRHQAGGSRAVSPLDAESRGGSGFHQPLAYNSWRERCIVRPRLRTDGLYICKITYFRQGFEEGAASQPFHVITYYRYLRFFNDPGRRGRLVLALVTTEPPVAVIDRLRVPNERLLATVRSRFFPATSRPAGTGNNSPHVTRSGTPSRRHQHRTVVPETFHPPTRETSPAGGPVTPNLFIGTYWREGEGERVCLSKQTDTEEDDNVASVHPDRRFRLLLFDAHATHPTRLSMHLQMGDPKSGSSSRSARCVAYFGRVEQRQGSGDTVPVTRIEFDTHTWGKFYFSRVKSYQS